MAKEYLNDKLASITADTALDGKTLVVETKRFTFPHVSNGNHYFQIKKVDADYAIYPLVPNADHTELEPAEEPVIFTKDKDIFFYVRRNLAPYMDKKFQQIAVGDDEVLEQSLIAAFNAYASSEFSMGKYNIQLTDYVAFDEPDAEETTTTSTTTSSAAPTTTSTTTTTVSGS